MKKKFRTVDAMKCLHNFFKLFENVIVSKKCMGFVKKNEEGEQIRVRDASLPSNMKFFSLFSCLEMKHHKCLTLR